MFYIEQKYGNDGYAAWIKILRQLSVTNHHYLNLKDRVEFMYLSSKCRVSEEILRGIIQDLCDLGEFNRELWMENDIIFSEKLVESVKDAYLKRNNKCITLPSLLQLLVSLGIRKLPKLPNKVDGNPQSRVEESKEEESRVDSTPIDIGKDGASKFVFWFNTLANRKFTATVKVKGMFKDRLKSYTKKDLMKAAENAHKDKHHIEQNFKYLTPEYILRPEKIEMFKNILDTQQQQNGVYVPHENKIDHSNREENE